MVKTNNSDRKQIQKSLPFTCGLEVHPFDVLNVELVQMANGIEMMSSKPIFDIYPIHFYRAAVQQNGCHTNGLHH